MHAFRRLPIRVENDPHGATADHAFGQRYPGISLAIRQPCSFTCVQYRFLMRSILALARSTLPRATNASSIETAREWITDSAAWYSAKGLIIGFEQDFRPFAAVLHNRGPKYRLSASPAPTPSALHDGRPNRISFGWRPRPILFGPLIFSRAAPSEADSQGCVQPW